jgi:drug/metabolite transporter (DMT)-like permease
MFVSSVALYLVARKAALMRKPVQFTNLAMFAVPLVVFCIADGIVRPAFNLSWREALLLVVAGVVLSYASNWISLKSIELAPNPGYSLVISKSYVVFTTILAVPLFGAALSWRAVVAILAIVVSAGLVMVDPSAKHRGSGRGWLVMSVGAFFGWGLLSLVAKYLFTQGVPNLVFLTGLFAVATACIVVEISSKRLNTSSISSNKWLFLSVGLLAASFNFFSFLAISMGPNVGYVNATNAASIGLVTIFSILLYGDEFSWRKVIGVAGVIGGLVLLLV